jgi:uncharacterized metal-binding protein
LQTIDRLARIPHLPGFNIYIMDTIQEHKNLYSPKDLELMRSAEDSIIMGKNRIEELRKFALQTGVKRIGIAHCVGMTREAMNLKERLSDSFEVFTIDCKYGKISSAELLDDPGLRGTSCNPAGQAAFLAENKTDLNISFGLCMGHDVMFNLKSKAPTTTLVVKDREHKHHTYKEFFTDSQNKEV